MDGFEIRTLTSDDVYTHRVLMAHAFSHGRVVPRDEAPAEEGYGKNSRGLFAGGKLQAALTTLPFDVHWGPEATLAMGGIAGVATFADARGRGYVDALLVDSLKQMRANGQAISSLYPFAWGFYRRYGWDWVGEKRLVTLPLRELRSSPEGRQVLSVESEAGREALESPYIAFAKRYRGMLTADTHQWKRTLSHNDGRTTHLYAYRPDGGSGAAESYLAWRFDTSGGSGRVREVVANSPSGYRGLLSLLHYFATQCEKAHLHLPADAPLWAHIVHWDMETKVEPVFMARVVDVVRAFELLPPAPGVADGACILRVRDEHAPWNDGLFRLTVTDGKVACAPLVGGAGEADVALDIQALSQAYWGQPSLPWLRAAGRLDVHGEDAFRTLAAILPAAPVYTLDDF